MQDDVSITTRRLKCECCDWAGNEADLQPDDTCPKCGEIVWSDQVEVADGSFDESGDRWRKCEACDGTGSIEIGMTAIDMEDLDRG